jgi:2-hydroxychromene-2-carboxylate isomerase
MTSLTFYFDPGCPFTWITSRWFIEATDRAGIDITWRSFPLAIINADKEVPAEYRQFFEVSTRALRVVESLVAEGRNTDAGAFYTAVGTSRFVEGIDYDDALLVAAGTAAGITDVESRLSDESMDARLQSGYDEIFAIVGGDVGSPAIRLDGTDRAFFGPVVSPAPKGDDADRLLAAYLMLLEVPGLFEVKRSRQGELDFS